MNEVNKKRLNIKARTLNVLKKTKKLNIFKKKPKNNGFRFFKHPLFIWLKSFNILLLNSPLFLLLYFIAPNFLTNANIILLLLILSISILAVWVKYYIFHRMNSYLIVPNEGLFVFSSDGIFSLNKELIPFNKIGVSDLQKKGLLAHIFNYGDIFLSSIITAKEGTGPKVTLKQVWKPEEILKKIKNMSHTTNNKHLNLNSSIDYTQLIEENNEKK